MPTMTADGMDATEVFLRDGELKQILLNVVRNAIQASPSGGTVDVASSITIRQVSIVVVDQGEGVSDDVAARMFDPFFSTRTDSRQGMGLGLSVSRSLAEAMGGCITVENNNVRGTRVNVTLPRRISSND